MSLLAPFDGACKVTIQQAPNPEGAGSLMLMGRQHRQAPLTARYTTPQVHLEILARIAKGERGTHSSLAAHLGMSSQHLTHKLGKDRTEWRIEDLSAIADFFDAPPGWPLVAWHISAAAFGHRP